MFEGMCVLSYCVQKMRTNDAQDNEERYRQSTVFHTCIR